MYLKKNSKLLKNLKQKKKKKTQENVGFKVYNLQLIIHVHHILLKHYYAASINTIRLSKTPIL